MLISTKKENDAERGWGLEGGVLGRAAREGAAQTPGLESIGKGGVGSLARGIVFFFSCHVPVRLGSGALSWCTEKNSNF